MARSRTRKRRFQENQHVVSKRVKLSQNSAQSTPSSRVQHESRDKASQENSNLVKLVIFQCLQKNENKVSGFLLIDISILRSIFKMLPSKNCFEYQLTLMDDSLKRMGCASCSSLTRNLCGWTEKLYTSEKNSNFLDVNRGMVYAMR